jgi:2-polyprenyl-6-methoxyphenol hydroxylase-like FAD-dependent oxidoreductase
MPRRSQTPPQSPFGGCWVLRHLVGIVLTRPLSKLRSPSTCQRGSLRRMALVGDVAHVASPMTGSGFHYSLLDELSLRQALSGEAVASALGSLAGNM